jgi:tetratricopeptide (TPR) repeat protein
MQHRALAALITLTLAAPLMAQTPQGTPAPDTLDPAKTYRLCLDTARTFAEQGYEFAGKWLGLGGGEPARHCQAVAMLGLGQYTEAANRLVEIAQSSKQNNVVRAGLLAQAAQAWLLSEDATRAYATQSAALELVPGDATLLIDRATILAAAKNYWEAIDDLNAVLAKAPDHVEALAFRASAYRMVAADDLALEDAERAVSLDPNHLSGLLERGILYRLKGRDDEARRDWLRILQLAPQSDAAQAARANIERLDVNPD